MIDNNVNSKEEKFGVVTPTLSLLSEFIASALSGIMANPNTAPTTQEHFENIAEDAVRIAKETIKKIN